MNEIVRKDFNVIKPDLMKLGLKDNAVIREIGFALQIWNDPKNSYLRQSNPESLVASVLQCAQIGLSLNPIAKEAYLIPRKNGESVTAYVEPSYIGLIKLLTDVGSIVSIKSNIVYEGDVFEIVHGFETSFRHVPKFLSKTITGVYAVAKLRTGDYQFEYMPVDEIHKIRSTSESWKAFERDNKKDHTPWVRYEGEMYRKTVIKRISKYLPRSRGSELVDKAIDLSNNDYYVSNSKVSMIESLIGSSCFHDGQKEDYLKELPLLNNSQADNMIQVLQDNQVAPKDKYISSQSQVDEAIDEAMSKDDFKEQVKKELNK